MGNGKDRIYIHVEDTGVGIPEKVKPKSSDPHSRQNPRGKASGLPYAGVL
jgi:signal transduction histidine kinase